MSSPVIDHTRSAGHVRQAAIASMVDLANQTFAGFERLARLNLQTMKTMLAEQHGIALEVVDSRSLGWMLTLPVAQAQAGLKKSLAYWQHVNEIAVETATQNAGAGWEGFRECAQWLGAAGGEAARTRPRESLLLSASGAGVSASAGAASQNDAEMSLSARSGGKRRAADIADGAGNVVSSVKQ